MAYIIFLAVLPSRSLFFHTRAETPTYLLLRACTSNPIIYQSPLYLSPKIVNYIEAQYEKFMNAETRVNRVPIADCRVHACLYFIAPSVRGLKVLNGQQYGCFLGEIVVYVCNIEELLE